ncbi:YuzF family protein [Halalkalibacterium ligniniphilum]|uniref:YuzF family protein n=1 Tax=Halalkalibacterium ligniniphilum TaxID=1134413 RepID=UPI000348E3C6|nr:YuzF family protein [Halalkalibacterium ligniniphilum]
MNQQNENDRERQNRPQMRSWVDPFFIQALQSVGGSEVIIETSRGNIRGAVADVKPDHVVMQVEQSMFFIRIQEIVWMMPV